MGPGDPEETRCECPADARIQRHFDRKTRDRLAAGEEAKLGPVSRRLFTALRECDPTGQTVLEAGCGRGRMLLELLAAGASRSTGIDLSPESIADAERRAGAAGVDDRTRFMVGDAATATLEPHDWVVLDKVFCCYRHVDRLLENSLAAAGSVYAFSVPTSRGLLGALARVAGWLEDRYSSMRGRGCPGYVHDIDRIERRLEASGFTQVRREVRWLWYIAVFRRPAERVV